MVITASCSSTANQEQKPRGKRELDGYDYQAPAPGLPRLTYNAPSFSSALPSPQFPFPSLPQGFGPGPQLFKPITRYTRVYPSSSPLGPLSLSLRSSDGLGLGLAQIGFGQGLGQGNLGLSFGQANFAAPPSVYGAPLSRPLLPGPSLPLFQPFTQYGAPSFPASLPLPEVSLSSIPNMSSVEYGLPHLAPSSPAFQNFPAPLSSTAKVPSKEFEVPPAHSSSTSSSIEGPSVLIGKKISFSTFPYSSYLPSKSINAQKGFFAKLYSRLFG